MDFFCQGRTLANEFADDKKCGFSVVTTQQIKKFGGNRGVRPIIEGKGQLAGCVRGGNAGSEKMRARMDGSIRCHACQSTNYGWRSDQRWPRRNHRSILA